MEPFQKIYLYKRIVQAKLFIDRHFADKIDLDNIADEACFSKFHFIRLFKNLYGKTPHHYLTQVRIEQAKKLLVAGHSVNATCLLVGFDSSTSFTALFKKHSGSTPSEYQQFQMQRRQQMAAQPLHFVPGCFIEKFDLTKNSNFQEM